MAAPTNQTPATATVIAALPASIVQDVHDAGTTYTVWYKYTAVQELVIGVFGYGGGGAYTPATEVYSDEGVTKIVPHPHPLVLPDDDKAVQFQVDKASTYWIRFITNPGDPSPALLQIEAETAPTESIATGAIAVPDDSDNRPCALLSQTVDYKVLNFAQPFPNGEAGDILDSGYILTEDGITFEAIGFHPDMTRDKTVISAGTGPLKIRTCRGPQRFYVAEYKGSPPISVSVVDASGVVVGTHSLTGVDFPSAIAASNDETILYHTDLFVLGPIRRWDLVNDVALTDFLPVLAGYEVPDILVLSDDSIVILYDVPTLGAPGGDTLVRRYSAAGALLNTYAFGATYQPSGSPPRLAYDVDDPTYFWVWTHTPAFISRFNKVEVATGVVTTVEHVEYEQGVYQPAVTATPISRFGNSFSCPFWIPQSVAAGASGCVPTWPSSATPEDGCVPSGISGE